MKNVTICIPTYNSSKYLKNNYTHIRKELSDIKIIYCDDCSTDGTQEILRDISKLDNNLTIIFNEQNMGQGYCRNKMIKYCKTQYIWFIDSDDLIHVNNFDFINDANDVDIYYMDFYDGKRKLDFHWYDNVLIFLRKILKFEKILYINRKIKNNKNVFKLFGYSSCNKIFKLDFILDNNLRFNEKYRFEDFIINQWMSIASRIFYTKSINYEIVGNINSTTRQNNQISEKWLDQCYTIIETLKLSKENIFFNDIVKLAIIPFYCISFYYEYFNKYSEFIELSKQFNFLSKKNYFIISDNFVKINYSFLKKPEKIDLKKEIDIYKKRFANYE